MRNLVGLGGLAVPCIVLAVVFLPSFRSSDSEVQRLRAHFATVERELLARDLTQLAPPQRAARALLIERLRAYAAAGVFPKNADHPGRFVPYFIDRSGTRCAMAHLIEQSGGAALVATIAHTHNNADIADLAHDPVLIAWLEQNGLSVAEAARIQPSYCGQHWTDACNRPAPPSPGYKAATGVLVLASASTMALNASLVDWRVPRRVSGWLGLGTGVAQMWLGLTHLGRERHGVLAMINVITGIAGMVAGGTTLSRVDAPARPRPWRAEPWVSRDGGAGLLFRIRF
jgi:hypothetical protein